ncbi:MAG: GNAT family N-acetyltransferase [Xanthomonadales bacterium]|nr:GNAT family N-acetyltransferase [Xanthomonadales bacterium]MCE7932750.1 N-acetyltransferase [Xanthomonadales bacterium PRO6]
MSTTHWSCLSARLRLRELRADDAPRVLALVNEPGWLRHIGDRGVRDLADALAYVRDGPLAMYARHGFGLWALERREDEVWLGMCGLLKRETLADVDLGYALLQEHWGRGYALEAAQACVALARERFGLARLVAIVDPQNAASIRLLCRLGMRHEDTRAFAPRGETLALYGMSLIDNADAEDRRG